MNSKQKRQAKQAAAKANSVEQTTAAPTAATATKTAKAPKAVDPQVAAAQTALAKAKADAKQAEQAAKDKRKAERAQAAAERAKTKAEPRPTCTGTKKDGTACTAKAKVGSELCVDHQPAWDRLTHEEHVAFGKWLRNARGPQIVAELGWFRAKALAKQQQTSDQIEDSRLERAAQQATA